MIPTTTIPISQNTAEAIQTDNFLKNVLFLGDIKESKDRILSFLNHYSKELDGRGHIYGYDDIYDVEIDESGEGGFEIKYTVSIHSGCRDVDADYQEEKYIFVSIDFEKGDATLTGNEVMPEREPDLY